MLGIFEGKTHVRLALGELDLRSYVQVPSRQSADSELLRQAQALEDRLQFEEEGRESVNAGSSRRVIDEFVRSQALVGESP